MVPPHGNGRLEAFQPPTVQPPTRIQGSQPRHPNDTVVAHIKQRMGSDAALLDYLAVNMVRVEPLNEENRPETARPYQMYVGKFPQDNGEAPTKHVRILLHIGPADGPPDIRYHIFADEGHSLGLIKAKDAFEEAEIYPPFGSLVESGGITESKVRAMVRYCFLVKRANLKNMWTINDQFIKDLVSACKTAQQNSASSKLVLQPIRRGISERERALQNRPSSYEQFWMQSVTSLNNRGERSRKKSIKVSATGLGEIRQETADSKPGDKPTRTARISHHPVYDRERSPNDNARTARGANMERTVSGPHDAALSLPQGTSAEEKHGGPADQANHNSSVKDPQSFIATYAQLLDEDNRYNEELEKIQKEQDSIMRDIERQQKRLAELRNDEERVRDERKRGENQRDNLHRGLSEGERALLAYGIQLGRKSNKRARISEDDADDDIAG